MYVVTKSSRELKLIWPSRESNSVKFIGIGCCSSQRASEHFNSMGQSLQLSQRMSKYRMERLVSAGDQVSVDGTFLDCNSTQISAAKVGKRKNGTYGQQINFALLVNSSSGLPVGYRWYSGDTHDVTTLDDLVEMWIDNGFQKKKADSFGIEGISTKSACSDSTGKVFATFLGPRSA